MKLEHLKENATVILFDGTPFLLMKVSPNFPDETADVCFYCNLRHLCMKDENTQLFKSLCTPEFAGQSCCFIENWDILDNTINDLR